jgi:hypothetical protein
MVLDQFTIDLPDVPRFRSFEYEDINPLSGLKKTRTLWAPNKAMRMIHRRFYKYLRTLMKLPYATGAVPKSSPLKNVEHHRRQRFFYLLDIRNFFPSIKGTILAEMLCQLDPNLLGKELLVGQFLDQYCLRNDRLLIGAPASPDLANIYMGYFADGQLGRLCEQYGLVYTRYLDDLTFSSKNHPIGKKKRQALRQVILDAHLEINHRKSVVHDIRDGPIIITGIGLRYGSKTFLPQSYIRKLRGLIHLAMEGKVPPAKVYGHMGAFFSSTRLKERDHLLSELERKMLYEYHQFLTFQRAA